MHHLPIFLNITGKRILVVGSGETADAKSRLIKLAGGEPHRCTCDSPAASSTCNRKYALAFVAVDNLDLAAEWATTLRAKGLLVNVADQPALCDFILPSIVDRNPVLVAISTGGASATVAKRLREAVEALLPAKLGDIVKAIGAARSEVAKKLTTTSQRRHFWDAVLSPYGQFDPLTITDAPSVSVLVKAAEIQPQQKRCITCIHPRSRDPDDLSLKMLRRLQSAEVIVNVGEGTSGITERGRRDARMTYCEIADLAKTLSALTCVADIFQIVVVACNDVPKTNVDGWISEVID